MGIYAIGWIILAFFLAVGLSWFQYFYKSKSRLRIIKLLFLLRFLGLFGLLLLFIDLSFFKHSYQIEKTPLVIAVDNSRSIKELNQEQVTLDIKDKLYANIDLNQRFDIQIIRFDSDVQFSDEFDFDGNQTRIDKLAKNIASIYQNNNFPTILLSDGNQTLGTDYVYAFANGNSVYPIVLGDTILHLDLKINQINVNRYAFSKNKFPVEFFLGYEGEKTVNSDLKIKQGNRVLFQEKVTFNKNKKSHLITALLDAEKVGVQVFQAVISSSENEKNTYNNIKNFAIEIIDQKKEIAIISDITHPDLGALKRSIESNQGNKVSILKAQTQKSVSDYDLVILYQPKVSFQSILTQIKNTNKNYFLITGKHTDYNFLNAQQDIFAFGFSAQNEYFSVNYRDDFMPFAQENIGFSDFPPLENKYGNIEIKQSVSALLDAKIRNINIEKPLLFFSENQNQRTAVLLGEGIWKWRLHHYTNSGGFDEFDVFVNKIIQYLATDNQKKSLIVNHENFYNSGQPIEITAQYFNKNYEFDQNARLSISIKNTATNQTKSYDLLKSNNYYKVNFDGLQAGEYSFILKELSSNTSYSGGFEVIDFDLEKQHTSADYKKLKLLAENTGGKIFFPNQINNLIDELLSNENFYLTQKEKIKKIPIIDFWVFLMIIVALFGLEWIVRKYQGFL